MIIIIEISVFIYWWVDAVVIHPHVLVSAHISIFAISAVYA